MEIFYEGEKFLDAERKDSILGKMKGLMFRELKEDEGMLMVFQEEGRWGVWMLFVPQDLALFFLDGEKKVVDKKPAEKMNLDPQTWKVYKPVKKCKYVLECKEEKLKEVEAGEKLEW
ncbi:MAG: DUF192 domain-containing protein [Candidatus Aenigmatarchaeota archaeon]